MANHAVTVAGAPERQPATPTVHLCAPVEGEDLRVNSAAQIMGDDHEEVAA